MSAEHDSRLERRIRTALAERADALPGRLDSSRVAGDERTRREVQVIETSLERVDHHPRRTVTILAAATIAAIAAVGVIALTRRPHPTVTAPSSTLSATSSSLPPGQNCSSGTLTPQQRFLCKKLRHPNGYQPQYSELGSGTDGDPTPAQQATLATEKAQYDPAEVQLLLKQAQANGNVPTDQALVATLEFRNACRELLIAVTAAESAPADQIAAVVDPIMNPEIARLTARTPDGSQSNQLFETWTQRIIAGQAPEVRNALGTQFCINVIPPKS